MNKFKSNEKCEKKGLSNSIYLLWNQTWVQWQADLTILKSKENKISLGGEGGAMLQQMDLNVLSNMIIL